MWRYVRPVKVRGDYIIGFNFRYFYNFSIREPIVFTYHRMILAELWGGGVRRNIRYHRGRVIWPIAAPKRGPMREEFATFYNL